MRKYIIIGILLTCSCDIFLEGDEIQIKDKIWLYHPRDGGDIGYSLSYKRDNSNYGLLVPHNVRKVFYNDSFMYIKRIDISDDVSFYQLEKNSDSLVEPKVIKIDSLYFYKSILNAEEFKFNPEKFTSNEK